MKVHFQQQLSVELLRSEPKRIIIIISIFVFLIGYRLFQGYFFEMSNDRGTNYYLTLQDADDKMILKSDCNDWKLLSIKTDE